MALADLESVIQDYRDKLAKRDAKTSELHGEVTCLVISCAFDAYV